MPKDLGNPYCYKLHQVLARNENAVMRRSRYFLYEVPARRPLYLELSEENPFNALEADTKERLGETETRPIQRG